MPSREPEVYKDKIEVSLDGRQIFYLFFGGAVIVGLVFVLGVMIGRRVEARGHVDRADTQSTRDPLAALDRLERSDNLSFRRALTGGTAPTDVEKAIGEIEKRRTAAGPARPEAVSRPQAGPRADRHDSDRRSAKQDDASSETRSEPKAIRSEPRRPDAAAERKGASASAGEPVTRPDGKDARSETRSDSKDARTDGKDTRSDSKDARADGKDTRSETRSDSKDARDGKDARSETRSDGKDARDGKDTRSDGKDARADTRDAKSESKPEVRAAPAAKPDGKSEVREARPAESKVRFTLQLSSFQDRSEADAFLTSLKSAGFQAYLVEAEVSGKGTFYRVRLGSYRSLEAANDAKAEYERSARKTAQVMRL